MMQPNGSIGNLNPFDFICDPLLTIESELRHPLESVSLWHCSVGAPDPIDRLEPGVCFPYPRFFSLARVVRVRIGLFRAGLFGL